VTSLLPMATNIEIKARISDLEGMRGLVEEISGTSGVTIRQTDTFFNSPNGRLKLRVLAPDRGELIYYERADASGPKRSNYLVSPTSDPQSLEGVLGACLRVRGVVKKQRTLYKVGDTRIHLDEVEGLGSFLELEVALGPDQSKEQGEVSAAELMARLGIQECDLVEVAYIDLLESRFG
jgi:predicted adenylyl cyclase CyaB